MQYFNKLSEFIRNKRKAANITLSNFCYKNNIEPSILSRFENGKQQLKIETLATIAKGFKQTPVEFLKEYEEFLAHE